VKWNSQSATMREGAMAFLNSTHIAKTNNKQKEMFTKQKKIEQIAFGNEN